jgi:hypothetical protein
MALTVKGTGENRKVTVLGNKKPCLIICTGDSITSTGGSSYVDYIKNFAQAGAPIIADVRNAAHAGQNLGYLSSVLQTEVLQYNPDIVSVCLLLNELFNSNIRLDMIAHINTIRAHINPNGKRPLVIGMTDNPTASDQNSTRPLASQDTTRDGLISAYSSFAATGEVFYADNYTHFLTYTRDSQAFLNLLLPDHIHPSFPLGHQEVIKTMLPALDAATFKFYNG